MQSVPLVPQPKPPGAPWRDWISDSPYGHTLVEAWRPGWKEPSIIDLTRRDAVTMSMNVCGLLWRPVAHGGEAIN